ncbi:MAG: hypothetical protein Kow0068_07760 [Marinilabiliales bacterium]
MAFSLTEYIVGKYYQSKFWLIQKNLPITPEDGKKYWSDIDILALKNNEVHLVSCKDYLPDNSKQTQDKIIKNLYDAEKYVKKQYFKDYENIKIVKIYVYKVTGKMTLSRLKDENIKTIHINKIICNYIKELDQRLEKLNIGKNKPLKGKRYSIIGEHTDLDKFIIHLLDNNFLNDNLINSLLAEDKKGNLSEIQR